MGSSQSSMNARRSLSSFFHGCPTTDEFLFKWNAALNEAFLEKENSDVLCIKAAELRLRNGSSGKEAEAEFQFSDDGALVLGGFENVDSTHDEEIMDRHGSLGDRTPSDPSSYRRMQQEIQSLKRENSRLSRALCEMDARSAALVAQCSTILQDNNAQLRAAQQLVSELSGIVKYLKEDAQEKADLIAELKVDKNQLNDRLEAAMGEIYRETESSTFSVRERLLPMTPRSAQCSGDSG